MLALNSPELDVRAITVVPGNVELEMGLDNALRMVSLANRCDIPVAGGARHPLFQKLITARSGTARMDWATWNRRLASARSIPLSVLTSSSNSYNASPHEITLVPVGPLTNIAVAVEETSSIVPLVKGSSSWAARSAEAT